MKSSNRRITMVDYWSITDENGKPLGHGLKVGNEYYNYIKDKFDVVQYVNRCVLPYIDNPQKKAFRHSLKYNYNKLVRVISNFRCLREAYDSDSGLLWFYAPELYLFLFLIITKKRGMRIALNVFDDYSANGIKNWIFRKAIEKAEVIFVTNKYLQKYIDRGIYVPDYAYDACIYNKYRCQKKKERAICLGSMNERKKLREAVEVFTQNGYPLHIAGQFTDKHMYEELLRIKGENVLVEDRYVNTDEYYGLLGSSKFCLIPYDSNFYQNRTSGVIQECLFCDAIPVSDQKILDFVGINGVGYGDITDLVKFNFSEIELMEYLDAYEKLRNDEYDVNIVKSKMVGAFEKG